MHKPHSKIIIEPASGATTQQDVVCPAVTREELKNKKAFFQRTLCGQGATTGNLVPSSSNVSSTSWTERDVQPSAKCYCIQMSAAGQGVSSPAATATPSHSSHWQHHKPSTVKSVHPCSTESGSGCLWFQSMPTANYENRNTICVKRHFRLLQRCCWRVRSSGMWRRVGGCYRRFEERSAFIYDGQVATVVTFTGRHATINVLFY